MEKLRLSEVKRILAFVQNLMFTKYQLSYQQIRKKQKIGQIAQKCFANIFRTSRPSLYEVITISIWLKRKQEKKGIQKLLKNVWPIFSEWPYHLAGLY